VNATETPGGPGIPAGWYDDPSGPGLRWWDGDAWTEHVHSAESAAAAAGAGPTAGAGGEREGAPPRDLVRLREWIRGRGSKTIGIFLGAAVLVIVVVALLLSGGSDDNGGSFQPGTGVPGAGQVNPGNRAAQAQLKALRRQLNAQHLPKAEKKMLEVQLKQLEKAAASAKGTGKPTKAAGNSAKDKVKANANKAAEKEAAPGEEGN
jgi:Protein of unknown function (DUF2510)